MGFTTLIGTPYNITNTFQVYYDSVTKQYQIEWGDLYEPQKQNKESKCSVQEPPRKKDIRFLNRST